MIRYRTTRRRFGAAALAATAAPAGAALAACGLPGGAGGAPEAATQIKPGSTVQWMYWSTPGPWLEANQKEAAAFEAQQAKLGLKVEQLNTPAGRLSWRSCPPCWPAGRRRTWPRSCPGTSPSTSPRRCC